MVFYLKYFKFFILVGGPAAMFYIVVILFHYLLLAVAWDYCLRKKYYNEYCYSISLLFILFLLITLYLNIILICKKYNYLASRMLNDTK